VTTRAPHQTGAEILDLLSVTRDGRKRPPKRERDAERAAEKAATLAHLEASGWKTHEGLDVALCPTCNAVSPTFVARRLRPDTNTGPMIVRCTACAGKGQP